MDLYILRHAIAVERGSPGFDDDSTRPLTEQGAAKMHKAATGIRSLGLEFDLVLSSPSLRARQTAEIVVRELGAEGVLEFSVHLEPGGSTESLIGSLVKRGPLRSVLLVGHEPYLSGLISVLLTGGGDMATTLKKGGLVKLAVPMLRHGRCASLEWAVTPGQLRRIAGEG